MRYILSLAFLLCCLCTFSQGLAGKRSEKVTGSSSAPKKLITYYLKIDGRKTFIDWRLLKVKYFILEAKDSFQNTFWTSAPITSIDVDDEKSSNQTYLIKVDLPESITKATNTLWCKASFDSIYKKGAPLVEKQYGGVTLSNITLHINSKPIDVEAFIVSNRAWIKYFEGKNWQQNSKLLAEHKVYSGQTNTVVHVDETNYYVLYKIGNTFKVAYHITKPMAIEKEQTVFLDLTK
jgi:hypothetical protein